MSTDRNLSAESKLRDQQESEADCEPDASSKEDIGLCSGTS